MRDWDWGAIWRGFRWIRLGVVLAMGLGGAWFRHSEPENPSPRMAAAIVRAFSEEAGFAVPQGYQVQPVRAGASAVVIRPDGQRFPARTVRAASLAHRLNVDLIAAGAEVAGRDAGIEEQMQVLRDAYGRDLGPDDQLAVVPPGWEIR
jgi:hypothetical protein